jgi:hypothetical protein
MKPIRLNRVNAQFCPALKHLRWQITIVDSIYQVEYVDPDAVECLPPHAIFSIFFSSTKLEKNPVPFDIS